LSWQDSFETGAEAYEFFTSTSSAWWFAKFPTDKIEAEIKNAVDYFNRKKVSKITEDIIFARGLKS